MFKKFLFSVTAATCGLFTSSAHAGKYDLDLTRLGSIESGNTYVTQNNQHFRSLSSELGTVVAPKPVDSADSLGLSGFAVDADISLNSISNSSDYWSETSSNAREYLPTLQVMGRKGLWPGLEVGAGATKLFDSRMWTAHGYGKLAIHEGFRHLPIPDIAIRGMFSRVVGATELSLSTYSLGGTISHVFGVGSTFNITPYGGYQALFIRASSNVLDATPGTDEFVDGYRDPDTNSSNERTEFVFARQDTVLRHRPFVGVRFMFGVLRVGAEAMVALAGTSGSQVTLNDPERTQQSVTDQAALQQQYTISLGLDF